MQFSLRYTMSSNHSSLLSNPIDFINYKTAVSSSLLKKPSAVSLQWEPPARFVEKVDVLSSLNIVP